MKKEFKMLNVLLSGSEIPVGRLTVRLFKPGDLVPMLNGTLYTTEVYFLGVKMQIEGKVCYLNTDAISIGALLNSFSKMSDEEVLNYIIAVAIKKSERGMSRK